MRLLVELRHEQGFACLFISHDLAITAALCEQVQVMYRGRVVESGPTVEVLTRPQHPYTALLVAAQLSEDPRRRRLQTFDLAEQRAGSGMQTGGCAFADRCPLATPSCAAQRPHLLTTAPGRMSACLQAGPGRHLVAQGAWSA